MLYLLRCMLLLWPRPPVLARTHFGLNLVPEPLVERQGELQEPGVLAAAIKFELLQEPRPIIWIEAPPHQLKPLTRQSRRRVGLGLAG